MTLDLGKVMDGEERLGGGCCIAGKDPSTIRGDCGLKEVFWGRRGSTVRFLSSVERGPSPFTGRFFGIRRAEGVGSAGAGDLEDSSSEISVMRVGTEGRSTSSISVDEEDSSLARI